VRTLGAIVTATIVVLLLRSTVLAALAVRGVVLDALAFATVVWGLRRGAGSGATFGFVIGLCADLDVAHWPGRHAMALALLGYIVGRLSGTLVRESPRAQFALLVLATAAHQVWAAAFELGGFLVWPELVSRAVVGAVATAAVGVAILWILRRLQGRPVITHAGVQPGKTI